MKIVLVLFILILLWAPVFASADCSKTGTTVIYINGIFGNEASAKADRDLLQQDFKYFSKIDTDSVTFINGFNASHGGGLADFFKGVTQMYTGGSLDYNLTNILRQTYTDLKTQKIVLVGYSQGSFYSNVAHDYLTTDGKMDKNSIAVYNVGTPATRVAGDNGKYLNSSTDKAIKLFVAELAIKSPNIKILPANITLELPADQQNDSFGGHYFSKNYLAFAPDRIISDIDSQINSLTANENKEECFTQPEKGIAYWVADKGYSFMDGIAKVDTKYATTGVPVYIANSVANYLHNLGKIIASGVQRVLAQTNLFGASLSATPVLNNPVVATDVQLAPEPAPEQAPEPKPQQPQPKQITLQDQLDSIQEQLDLIQQEINNLTPKPAPIIVVAVQPLQPVEPTNQPEQNQTQNPAEIVLLPTNTDNFNIGGGGSPSYPKILISEVQIAGATDEKQEFVELYNPNDADVDLTSWYLQRKTAGSQSWSTYTSNSLFSGKTISKNGYFLIARTGYYPYADIFTDNSITDDNSFALKNPSGDISDKLGFGSAKDFENTPAQNPLDGQSIGRKVLTDGTEEETENNSADFELQTLTPKAKNIVYTAPPEEPPPTPTQLSITTYTISNLTIDLEFSETVNADVDILDAVGTKVRDLYSSSSVKNPEPKTWDGKDLAGIVAPNGVYTIKVVITNSANNSITDTSKTITINNPLHSDAFVTSATYVVSELVDGAGTIKGVMYKTGKNTFSSAITSAVGAVLDLSGVLNPVATGDILFVTAEDGVTKATYTITVDTVNLAQGTIDSFTPDGKFILHVADFMPNQSVGCSYILKNELVYGTGGCPNFFSNFPIDMTSVKTIGEHDIYLSYGEGRVENYYKTYFDGSVWSVPEVDITKTRLSAETGLKATSYYIITSVTPSYSLGIFTGETGTIKNVLIGTSKTDFESGLTGATGATIDFLGVSNPVVTGDTLTVTAEDGVTKAVYTIEIETIKWSPGTIISYDPIGKFVLDTSFFTEVPGTSCYQSFYKSLFPYVTNGISIGSFGCEPTYSLVLSSLTDIGDYTIWLYDKTTNLGKYYETHFDGAVWSAENVVDTTFPSIITYTISNLTISPNNDGVDDTTEIDWKFSEPVKANVDIIDASSSVVFQDFYKSDSVTNPHVKTWDGKDSLGVVVPDGIYTIKITITDKADNTTTDTSKTIIVNTVTP